MTLGKEIPMKARNGQERIVKRDKTLLLLLAFVLLFFASTIGAAYLALKVQPVIEPLQSPITLEPEVLDLGESRGETLEGVIRIKNHSRGKVRILHVTKSCSCTLVWFPQRELEPGETVDMKCTMSMHGYEGEVHGRLDVACLVPEINPSQPLYFGATVRAYAKPEPDEPITLPPLRQRQ